MNDRDKVRLRCGDTDPAEPHLSDQEISVYIEAVGGTAGGTILAPGALDLAAAGAAEAIAAGYADGFDFQTDGQRFDRAQRVAHYRSLADELRHRGGPFAVRSVGGTAL